MDVLIIDDEPLARERLARLVGQPGGYRVLEPSASNDEEVLTLINILEPDTVLLDIRMLGLGGLQVTVRLCEREVPLAVIFYTARGEFALEAFQVSAMGYPAKPVHSEDLAEALKKVSRLNCVQLAVLTKLPISGGGGPHSHTSTRTRKRIGLIPLEEVIFFTVDHKYVILRHAQGEVLSGKLLKALEDEFGERSMRIHRNALIARERIEHLQRVPLGHFQLYLKGPDGNALTISRRRVTGVKRLMHQL